ncbi:MAG: single-stranded DNA-binding protein [candidate division WOR-3 bacterium]|nr:single-stranded DNA-binding protein [candidate division WOR-3 bacterium]MCX7836776.1 single-stranded DNA-binding protein [candidate division WOR-3 bacterium]MDW8113586.1 single-stranded DNA-binding protein [candidate division WOR-3 bacterium]
MAEIRLGRINYVILMGRATVDPTLRYNPKGIPFLSFQIAVNRVYKDKESNEWKEVANFFTIVTSGPKAERLQERLKKGSAVIVEGELRSRSYEKENGEKRNVVEIFARRVQILDKFIPEETEEEIPEDIILPDDNLDDLPF